MSNTLNILGAKRMVETAELMTVATPDVTYRFNKNGSESVSHQPISHYSLFDRVATQLNNNGVEIIEEAHALARDDQRYFGLMKVRPQDWDDATQDLVVGVRNAHDKSIPATIAFGSQVMVCSNLQISSEVVLARRHTANIERDLDQIIARTLGSLADHRKATEKRTICYKDYDLGSTKEVDHIIMNAYRAGAIPKTKIVDVLEQWENPNHPEFKDRNAWSLHNAFTEVLKCSLMELPKRSQALNFVFDSFTGVNQVQDVELVEI